MSKCPTCRKPVDTGLDNPCRPFCSERCRLIDLGDWIAGRHSIPTDERPPGPEDPDTPITRH